MTTGAASNAAPWLIEEGNSKAVQLPALQKHQTGVLVWLPKVQQDEVKRLWRIAVYVTGTSATQLSFELSEDTDLWFFIGLPGGVKTSKDTIKQAIHLLLKGHERDGAPITLKGGGGGKAH